MRAVRAAVVLGTVMPLATASAGPVGVGTDFLVTQPGTSFDLGSLKFPVVPGLVPLIGNAAPGDFFDTAIERLASAMIDGPTAGGPLISDPIPIEIIALSLRSVDPVAGVYPFDSSFFDVFVELDLGTPSTGTMTINHELDDRAGGDIDTYLGPQPSTGTWSTVFTLNLIFTLVEVEGNGPDFEIIADLVLLGSGNWTHGPGGEFLLGPILEVHEGGAGSHEAAQMVPLPAPVWLGSLGILAVIVFRRRFMFM